MTKRKAILGRSTAGAVAVCLALLCVLACHGEKKEASDAARSKAMLPTEQVAQAGPGDKSDSLQRAKEEREKAEAPRNQYLVRRDLVFEQARSDFSAGGLWIDAGTAGMHKYSRGGFENPWSRNQREGPISFSRIEGGSAWLDIHSDTEIREIHLRSRGKLRISTSSGSLASVSSGEWKGHRIVLKKPLAAGEQRLKFSGRGSKLDWIWLRTERGELGDIEPTPPANKSKAIVHAAPTSQSFYFEGKPGDILSWSARSLSSKEASFEVFVASDDRDERSLGRFSVTPSAGTQQVPLKLSQKEPMRLRLVSSGGVEWKRLQIRQPRGKELPAATKQPKNIIVLLIDTQRADSFSPVAGDKAIGAAAFESLVQGGTSFSAAYNNENWTKPSIASFDTGLYPSVHKARWRKDRCSKDLLFLSEHLKAKGFATAAMVSNISAGPKFGFNQGWDSFEKTDNAKLTFARAQAWLEDRRNEKKEDPFFLYVQTIDPHVPFSVPEGSAEKLFGGSYTGKLGPSFEQSEEDALNEGKLKLSSEDSRWLQALYDAEVLYHDAFLGQFVDYLKSQNYFEDTAFVILNDHGEEFGEKGRWGHGWTMGDALFRSPLLMYMPGFFPAQKIEESVEHIDVAPTLVDALGIEALPDAHGSSLLPLIRGEAQAERFPFSALLFGRPKKRAIRVGDYKLLIEGRKKSAVYNMVADPAEKLNLLGKRPIAERLLEIAMGEALANPKRDERLADQSTLLKIRQEYIKE